MAEESTNTTTEQTQAEPHGEASQPQGTDWKAEARKWEARAKANGQEAQAYKEKAAKFDELEEAKKSELEKANEKAASLEEELAKIKATQAHAELVSKVANETGIPASLLHGSTEEELKATANLIHVYVEKQTPGYPKDKGGAAQGGDASMTREKIAQIKDPMAQLKAIRDNKDLFN